MFDYKFTIPKKDWEAMWESSVQGDDEAPDSDGILHCWFFINGVRFQGEAVLINPDHEDSDVEDRAVDPVGQHYIERMQEAFEESGPFELMQIKGRPYLVWFYPYERG